MAFLTQTVTIGTTPTLLVDAPAVGTLADVWVEVYNNSGVAVYIGGADVSTTSGRPVANGDSWSWPLSQGDAIYAVVGAATADVYVSRGRA